MTKPIDDSYFHADFSESTEITLRHVVCYSAVLLLVAGAILLVSIMTVDMWNATPAVIDNYPTHKPHAGVVKPH